MRTEPLISIVMPAWNAASFIGEAISSVQKQTWQNWELLVVDNGSTDDTAAIVQDYDDPRIQLLFEAQRGVSHARNKALVSMRGAFYCFLDADDRLPKTSLADRAALLMADSNVHFADGAIHAFSANDPQEWIRRPRYRGPEPLPQLFTITDSCFLGPTWMIRRAGHAEQLFRTEMTHAEDLFYYMCIAHRGAYNHVSTPVLYYRIGHGSAMSDLVGLHRGYRQLIMAMRELPHPPDEGTTRHAWSRIKSIMWKSYLKRGMFASAISVIFESRPTPITGPKAFS